MEPELGCQVVVCQYPCVLEGRAAALNKDWLASPQSRHVGKLASFHLNRMALHWNTQARDWSTGLLQAEVFMNWSTLPSVLSPWSGLVSQAVEREAQWLAASIQQQCQPGSNLDQMSWIVKYHCLMHISADVSG